MAVLRATPWSIREPCGQFDFSFKTSPGRGYTLQRNGNLATTNWVNYTNITGDGAVRQLVMPIPNATQQFFRVRSP